MMRVGQLSTVHYKGLECYFKGILDGSLTLRDKREMTHLKVVLTPGCGAGGYSEWVLDVPSNALPRESFLQHAP
jgi:hypothetical protein